MKKLRIVFIFCVFALVSSVSIFAQGTNDPVKAPNDRYRIGFQDVLEVQVFKHPELGQRVPVSSNGTIVLFRLDQPVVAICKTERELASEIAASYKAKYLRDPQVTVVVAEQKSQSVMVIGAVEKPGNYYVNRRVHLLEMLALAGGPNKESGTRMIVARTGSTSNCKEAGDPAESDQIAVMDFKIRDVQQGKQSMWMQPGDVVSVLDADVVYVYGDVNKQGSYKVRETLTLTQAIVTAEGLMKTAKKDKVRVLRQKAGSQEREELVFDLNQIDKGKMKDPFLEPNDIVAVSQDSTKAVLYGVASFLKTTAPSAIYRIP
ncbi:hypothetical protein BH10ACI3_BH10ACI3_11620 [soil metagenome]